MLERYTWHQNHWIELGKRFATNKLAHALLFTGTQGIGKREFAQQYASVLLCDTIQARALSEPFDAQEFVPCGKCQSCGLIKAGNHPDLSVVEPLAEGKVISVDQVRELSNFLSFKSQYGNRQIIIIEPAEKMNKFAANSLLKTLEEPTPGSLIILISAQPSLLLPTIRSRCQTVVFHAPTLKQALVWLQAQMPQLDAASAKEYLALSNGGPLLAYQWAQEDILKLYKVILESVSNVAKRKADPVAVAKQCSDWDAAKVIKWLILWTTQMIRLKSSVDLPDSNPDTDDILKKMVSTVDLRGLFKFFDKLLESNRLLTSQVNQQLLMEDVLIFWRQLQKTATR
ncbi:DNA polymerase III subunit delta' [Kaarinaea lacus]